MYPFRNHKAATAGIPEHQMIKVKFPNMQQLTKAKRHVYLTAKKHYPRTSHHNHKTLRTETLYVKNGGIQFHNALKSVICHIYTAKCLKSSSQNRHNKKKKTQKNKRYQWKKAGKAARKLGNSCIPAFSRERIPHVTVCHCLCKHGHADASNPREWCLKRTKGFF